MKIRRCCSSLPSIALILCMVSTVVASPRNTSPSEVDASIKTISRQYAGIEDQIKRSIHYAKTTQKGDQKTVRQAWFNEAGDLLKVSDETTTVKGRILQETFLKGETIFVLLRKEEKLPDGNTRVEESRKYFGPIDLPRLSTGDGLLRELAKSATFKPGETLDTSAAPNRRVVPNDPAREDGYAYGQQAERIADDLLSSKPDQVPAGFPLEESVPYRLIHRTASPNGRYVLGWAPEKKEGKWSDYSDTDSPDYAFPLYSEETDGARPLNYVVDLDTHASLGTTPAHYEGTRHSYNHREIVVTWSPDSRIFIQTTKWKWYDDACCVGLVDNGKMMGCQDILKLATEQAYQFLEKHKDKAYAIHKRGFAISILSQEAADDGVIRLVIEGEIPKSEEENSSFEVVELFRINNEVFSIKPLEVSYKH